MKSVKGAPVSAPIFAAGKAGGPGLPLVRLLDLAEEEAARSSLPFSEAARRLADALERRPGIQFFIGQAAGFSAPMQSGHVWDAGCKASPAALYFGGTTGARTQSWRAAVAARPALVGAAGALEVFRKAVAYAARAEGVRLQPMAALAVLRSDAAELFGYGVDPAPVVAISHTPVVRLVADDVHKTAADLRRTKEPGEKWTETTRADLLKQFDALKCANPSARVSSLHEQLGSAWGYRANSIKNFLAIARQESQPVGVSKHWG